MKKHWNSHIRAKNPIDVTPAKAGVQCLLLEYQFVGGKPG
jgi:hypothetical protein